MITNQLYRRVGLKLRRKAVRRRVMRSGLILSNILILIIIIVFVLQYSGPKSTVTSAVLAGTTSTSAVLNPVDQLSSANIALTVARLNSLPETTAIANQAQSQLADMAIASSDNNVLNKPQLVSTGLKSKADIKTYTVVAGDSFTSLSALFGVTSDSLRWSNPSVGSNLTAGKVLVIPPVNGIVYTVKAGDTVDSLASSFKANKDQIIAYNDAEISGIQVGEQIIVPNGTQIYYTGAYNYSYNLSWGGPSYGSNGYSYGYCTWYVANQVSVPSNWGNASSWAYYARLSGWTVSPTPTVGAIAQTTYSISPLGHVAVVREVNSDGTIWVSEMNASGQVSITNDDHVYGWGVVDWRKAPASSFQNYITQ